jgi:ubiquinone biosynthesis protein
MDWESLIDERGLASLLSDAYAHFARPVKEGLIVFLTGLPDDVQREILARQAAIGPAATISMRLGQLARSCPVLHKLGQTLARDARLAPELRAQLHPLESLEPTTPWDVVQQTLIDELGPLHRRGIILGKAALAEASVAVVVPFKEREGGSTRHGVLKVLRPGIESRLELELDLLGRVAWHLDQRCTELRIPQLDYRDVFNQVRNKLAWETRLDQEQQNLTAAKGFYANEPAVQIPSLLPHCTRRATAMERIRGVKVTDARLGDAWARRRLGQLVAKALVARPIFATTELAPFHCDPHAGNLFLTDEGRLAILDWSLVGYLQQCERVAMPQIILAALSLNGEKIEGLMQTLAQRGSIDQAALGAIVRDRLQQVRRGRLPGFTWLVELLDDATQRAGLRASTDLMLLRKSLLTLAGVVTELAEDDGAIDAAVLADFVGHFVAEFPQRWGASPGSRNYATGVSNADLLELALSWPLAAGRYWLATGRDPCCCKPQLA